MLPNAVSCFSSRHALKFADELTTFFKTSRYMDFANKFGEQRMGSLIGTLDRSVVDVFQMVLLDNSIPVIDRLMIFRNAGNEPILLDAQRAAYDRVRERLQAEFLATPLGQSGLQFEAFFNEPPGMEEYRLKQAEEVRQREAEREAQNRAETERN